MAPLPEAPGPETCDCSGSVSPVASESPSPQPSTRSLLHPTWDDIAIFFHSPSWVPPDRRERTGSHWIRAMRSYDIDLGKYVDVKRTAVTIYRHLRSKSMPLTDDPDDYFPEWALETLRAWVNDGCPRDVVDIPTVSVNIIPPPNDPSPLLRIRKDLQSLTSQELTQYRDKLTSLGIADVDGKWQELGLLHANWCLHYQEATFLWHRAYLLHVESLLGCPIPYWNGFSAAASDPSSPQAGLPKEFLDDVYTNGKGETCPNPLKFACAMNGHSKVGGGKYVSRDPILVAGPSDPRWYAKIEQFALYQKQILLALRQRTFSEPQNVTQADGRPFAAPWANIATFEENSPDCLYPYRGDFDGLFEQPHDNFHGWVGGDMADNSYTAFDPIFLSYHANMDRLVEQFLRADPDSRGLTFTANFPLKPFTDVGTKIHYSNPNQWMFTTIGDMTKSTHALGYTYGTPSSPDATDPVPQAPAAALCQGFRATKGPDTTPFVLFSPVNCIPKSYQIDMYAEHKSKLYYIGRETRIGMGPGQRGDGPQNRDRCIQRGVTRILDARSVAGELRADDARLVQVVMEIETGRKVPEEEWSRWGGFKGRLVWGNKKWGM